jgi:hypothetical protein
MTAFRSLSAYQEGHGPISPPDESSEIEHPERGRLRECEDHMVLIASAPCGPRTLLAMRRSGILGSHPCGVVNENVTSCTDPRRVGLVSDAGSSSSLGWTIS